MNTVTEKTEDIDTQAKVLVDSAILRDIQTSALIRDSSCSGDKYENCIYENRE